jgi:hypothetical protein
VVLTFLPATIQNGTISFFSVFAGFSKSTTGLVTSMVALTDLVLFFVDGGSPTHSERAAAAHSMSIQC